jgi:cytosine/adenosine deaminase-related metal-dependent hydrolase
MTSLLVRNATVLVTHDAERRELAGGGFIARDGIITQVGPNAELPDTADEVLDLRHHVVLPGLINTHHHLYQTLTRAVPAAQDAALFDWLRALYPIWARLTPEAVRVSTLTGLAELALSGCTTSSDHLYLYPNGCRLDDAIEAASEIGLRFHPTRGSMSLGESRGGLPPDRCVEDEASILRDSQRVVEAFHDPSPGAMLRIGLAPCSPFSVTPDLMRQTATLARSLGVRLHTHLAETLDEERFCLETVGRRPVEYLDELGWLGPDTWFAHTVHVDTREIEALARSGSGVAHCPTSNMRLASGIAPVRQMRGAGVPLGLGVDGSASNDGSNLLAEARQAMLLARLAAAERRRRTQSDAADTEAQLSAREALEIATLGGAAVLGRDDIGALAVGQCADFFAIDLRSPAFAGALHDPVAAVVFCAPAPAAFTYVHGRAVVRDGQMVTVDLPTVIERQNRIARDLLDAG